MERSTRATHALPREISGTYVEITGVIADDPIETRGENESKSSWSFKLKVEEIKRRGNDTRWRTAGGTINASWRSPRNGRKPSYGARWRIPGMLYPAARAARDQKPLSTQKYRLRGNWYRADNLSDGHGNPFVAWCYRQRHSTADCLSVGIEDFPDHVALLHALVLGYRQKLPRAIWSDFALTGSLHIFAISGLHVGMVACIITFLLTSFRVSRVYWSLFLSPLLLVYTIGTGMRASAVRACIMAIIYFSAPLLKRKADGLSTLSLAGLIILSVAPTQLFDRGFIFSFVVVTGLIVLYQHIHRPISRLFGPDPLRLQVEPKWILALRALGKRIASLTAISCSAWLASAPLSAYFFGQFTPIALLSNLMVVPLAFLIVLTGSLSLILGSWLSLFADLFNHANLALIALLQQVIGLMAFVPYGSIEVAKPPLLSLCLWYAALLFLATRCSGSTRSTGTEQVAHPHLDKK
jgi:ComEC/Rec2-related protein